MNRKRRAEPGTTGDVFEQEAESDSGENEE